MSCYKICLLPHVYAGEWGILNSVEGEEEKMEGWAGAGGKGASAAKADGRSAVVLITARCAQTLIRHGLHSGLCVSRGHHSGFFLLCFSLCILSVIFDPREGGVKATAGKRRSETLRRGPAAHLPPL